jgi:DNA polymerase-1
MHHIKFKDNDDYDACILIKKSLLNKDNIQEHYLDHLDPKLNIIAFSLDYNEHNKSPAKLMKLCIDETLKTMRALNIRVLYVADAAYFKKLTNRSKTDLQHGIVNRCKIPDYYDISIILGISYKAISFNPLNQDMLDLSLKTFNTLLSGITPELGSGIVHSARYPKVLLNIEQELEKLHQYPALTLDVETYGLKLPYAIATIAFAWDEHNGLAFTVDKHNTMHDTRVISNLLRSFLIEYKGTLIYHHAIFDIKVLIYTLWMEHTLDTTGLLEGLEVLTNKIEDTRLITYLATNSTRGNKLRLKEQAYEFAGDYGIDVTNNHTTFTKDLLEYNLKDALCTWYVFNKHYKSMCDDNQLDVYRNIFIPSVKLFIQIELTGMPMNPQKVHDLSFSFGCKNLIQITTIRKTTLIKKFMIKERRVASVRKNLLLIKKVTTKDDFNDMEFNPGSSKQVGKLLHDYLELPIIDKTPTGLPKTSSKTLKKVLVVTQQPEHKELIQGLIDYAELATINSTFIPAFQQGFLKKNCQSYLHGSFNLGGTVSGRLSSSDPNMMNLPSTGTVYAKSVKECFEAPKGWLMGGVDFDSLEDKVSALTTRDPNKLKVYEDGYDGHCLRAYSYYGSQMPDITQTVESINSIKEKYPEFRQASKEPTFLLTYGGTSYGLIQSGIPNDQALMIEQNYHDLYKVSDAWVAEHIDEATKTGYVVGAFGLRLRTPILSQVILNKKNTPYEARKEARTAGNMKGQSYGQLNNRAGIEFQKRVLASVYREDILPIGHIHDSQYFIFRDNIDVVYWVNINLIECIEWQELEELKHETVKLSGQFFINYPDWSHEIKIPNKATKEEIKRICKNTLLN